MKYRLLEVEDVVAEMDLAAVDDDIAEIEDDLQLIVCGWSAYIPKINMTLKEGVVCVWDEEDGMFMPDFSVTVIYEGSPDCINVEPGDWLYYEQDGFAVSLANYMSGKMTEEQIEQLWCELIIPED